MHSARTTLVPDRELGVEAYLFQGFVRPFARHFHAHYVFGLVKEGSRTLRCAGRVWHLCRDHVLLINPGENHGCEASREEAITYLSLSVPVPVMEHWAGAAGLDALPSFAPSAVNDADLAGCLRLLHASILQAEPPLRRKELLGYLLFTAMERYARPASDGAPAGREEIERACRYLEQNFREHILLDELCAHFNLSKSTLLRSFLNARGVTPHQYLTNIRIAAARKLLEEGVAPGDVAAQTGFVDQSHFSRAFTGFIGIPPGLYREMFAHGQSALPKHA